LRTPPYDFLAHTSLFTVIR